MSENEEYLGGEGATIARASSGGLTDAILGAFDRWSEDQFSQLVIVPLLKSMGLREVRFTGGTREKGIDVLYHELSLPEHAPRFTGIQTKKGNITARVGKSLNPASLEDQIRQAFEKPVGLIGGDPYTRISTLVICSTGKISPEARREIENATHGDRRLGAPIRFWDGETVADFIVAHWLPDFAQLAGIELPQVPTPLLVQDVTPFTHGRLLAESGLNSQAIPFFERSIFDSSFSLANAHYGDPDRDPREMVKAANTAIVYDKGHYNQHFIAGYGEFVLGDFDRANEHLLEARKRIDDDKTPIVQRGPGFQEKHLQSTGMLAVIAEQREETERRDELMLEYRSKYQFLTGELGYTPRPLGDWEKTLLEQAALEDDPESLGQK